MSNLESEAQNYIRSQFIIGGLPNEDTFRILNEEHGYVPNIDEYVEKFSKCIENALSKLEGKNAVSLDFGNEIFEGMPCFFNAADIHVSLSYSNTWQYKGGYNNNKSRYSPKYGFYLVMGIMIKAPDDKKIYNLARSVFAHEITHAYEDYKRQSKGKASIKDYQKIINYAQKYLGQTTEPTTNGKILSEVLYLLTPLELRAMVGMLKTELQPYAKNINGSKSSMEVIKNTQAWAKYMQINQNIEALNSIKDEFSQNKLVQIFNRLNEITVDNYSDMLRILNRKWYKWKNAFLYRLSKIAYDVYEKYGGNYTL